jgi:hypothetical protein
MAALRVLMSGVAVAILVLRGRLSDGRRVLDQARYVKRSMATTESTEMRGE